MSKTSQTPVIPGENGPTGIAATAVVPAPIARSTSRTSRIGVALASVRSIEAHPPHHAHFDLPVRSASPGSPGETESGHRVMDKSKDGTPGQEHEDDSGPGDADVEGSGRPVLDIEHMPCDDDPREWSVRRKNFVLMIMTIAVVSHPS